MNKLKEGKLPQKRALTVDEIISKYPEGVRVLLVELVSKIESLQKKPEVTEEFVEMLRDRLMTIPIREYFTPNKRKIIVDKIRETFIKHGVEVVGK